jgi:hypothetical protein
MKVDLEFFLWNVPTAGFSWQDGRVLQGEIQRPIQDVRERRFLVANDLTAQQLVRRYNPFTTTPTLFKTFSTLGTSESDYLAFANEYGDLGVDRFLTPTTGGASPRTGEPLWIWQEEHRRLREVVDLLDAIAAQDLEKLRLWITISDRGARYERDDDAVRHYQWIAIQSGEQQLRAELYQWAYAAGSQDAVILRFAQGLTQALINAAIHGDRHEGLASTSARVLLAPDRDKMVLHIVPHNLLGAMWLQCARVLTENTSFRQCEQCLKWFEISADQRRKQSKYCSDRCKVSAYRARKAKQVAEANDPEAAQ